MEYNNRIITVQYYMFSASFMDTSSYWETNGLDYTFVLLHLLYMQFSAVHFSVADLFGKSQCNGFMLILLPTFSFSFDFYLFTLFVQHQLNVNPIDYGYYLCVISKQRLTIILIYLRCIFFWLWIYVVIYKLHTIKMFIASTRKRWPLPISVYIYYLSCLYFFNFSLVGLT